jgi:UPF0755 protein
MRRYPHSRGIGKFLAIILASLSSLLIVGSISYAKLFGPIDTTAPAEDFFVQEDTDTTTLAQELTDKGYVRGAWIFDIAFIRKAYGNKILPGGYKISKSMDAWTIASTLLEPPYAAWIKIPVGVRKEQIATQLADRLGWSDVKKQAFLDATMAHGPEYIEGVYLPDTYFIPTDLAPQQVEEKIRSHFNTVFEPYSKEAVNKHMPWPTVLTIASLIQREAGSAADMPIISGIIQNRLRIGMPLAIDATFQYMDGNETDGWWSPPRKANSYPNSPFNTYKNKGLPPHPISEPGVTAIEAALNPTQTNCLFYIHDNNGRMHCSPTYAGQLSNVQKYLR